jgi:hypothetical protein
VHLSTQETSRVPRVNPQRAGHVIAVIRTDKARRSQWIRVLWYEDVAAPSHIADAFEGQVSSCLHPTSGCSFQPRLSLSYSLSLSLSPSLFFHLKPKPSGLGFEEANPRDFLLFSFMVTTQCFAHHMQLIWEFSYIWPATSPTELFG